VRYTTGYAPGVARGREPEAKATSFVVQRLAHRHLLGKRAGDQHHGRAALHSRCSPVTARLHGLPQHGMSPKSQLDAGPRPRRRSTVIATRVTTTSVNLRDGTARGGRARDPARGSDAEGFSHTVEGREAARDFGSTCRPGAERAGWPVAHERRLTSVGGRTTGGPISHTKTTRVLVNTGSFGVQGRSSSGTPRFG